MKQPSLLILTIILLLALNTQASQNNPSDSVGRSVLLNKSKIFYYRQGKGNIPVVFVSGLGEPHDTWNQVQDSLANFAETLSYDRSGLGKSGYHQEKKDLVSMTEELNNLVNRIKLKKPFIIVGHSLGCQIAKEYARLHPRSLKAIIFIDPGYNEENLRTVVSDSMWKKREKALAQYLPEFNAAQKEELIHLNKNVAVSDSIKLTLKVPMTLFTATKINPDFPCSSEELAVKEASHNLWLKTLPTATHKIVPDSRHYIQNDNPSLIISSILPLIK